MSTIHPVAERHAPPGYRAHDVRGPNLQELTRVIRARAYVQTRMDMHDQLGLQLTEKRVREYWAEAVERDLRERQARLRAEAEAQQAQERADALRVQAEKDAAERIAALRAQAAERARIRRETISKILSSASAVLKRLFQSSAGQ